MPSFRHLFAEVDFSQGQLYDTSDLDFARAECARVFNPHEVKVIGRAPGFRGRMDHLPMGNVSLNRLTWGTTVTVDPHRLNSYYLLSMPVSGKANFVLDGQENTVDDAHMGIVNASQRFHFQASEKFDQVVLRLEKEMVEHCWEAITGHPVTRPVDFHCPVASTDATWRTLDPMFRVMLRDMANNREALKSSFVQCRLEEMLVMVLLFNQPHSQTHLLGTSSSKGTPRQLRCAKEFMMDHLDKPLRLTDVAHHVGCSTRQIQLLFHELHKCGPMQWWKEQRLHAVHKELTRIKGEHKRIAEIAMRYGFFHLGEFNQAYKKYFGVTPRMTQQACN